MRGSETFESVALHEVAVIRRGEDTTAESAHEAFDVAIGDVERKHTTDRHCDNG